MINELKAFALRGNVVDMAVGIIIGAAFSSIVQSLVNDIIMPPIGMLLGDVDFSNLFVVLQQGSPSGPYGSLSAAQEAGAVTINYGQFTNTIVSFIIVATALFFVIRAINRFEKKDAAAPPEPTTKDCPFCFTEIPIKALRCPNCTSEI
jgi:large conductance mechanosensitive channel